MLSSIMNIGLKITTSLTIVANKIFSSMHRLDLMINDLPDAGKLRAGKHLNLNFIACELDTI